MRWLSISAAVCLAFVVALKVFHPDAAKVKPIVPDRGPYYRMKVGLTYKGQPVDIDIVVGCGVHASFSVASGGSTVETMSMSAARFGASMPEGHAVVIGTVPFANNEFSPCRGDTTKNGKVPKNWLPLIVWYEREDELAHGVGYVTQDAYENPNARFGFGNAAIVSATRAEFDEFLKHGRKNLIPPYIADWMSHLDTPLLENMTQIPEAFIREPAKAWMYGGWAQCYGAYRVKLTEAQRAKVRAAWPIGHPQYWISEQAQREFRVPRPFLSKKQWSNDLRTFSVPYTPEQRQSQPKVYPIDVGESLGHLSKDAGKDGYVHNVLIGDGGRNLGFEFCERETPENLAKAVSGRAFDSFSRLSCQIDGIQIDAERGDCFENILWQVFERDEYAIFASGHLVN